MPLGRRFNMYEINEVMEKARHRTGAELIHEYWQKCAKEMKESGKK